MPNLRERFFTIFEFFTYHWCRYSNEEYKMVEATPHAPTSSRNVVETFIERSYRTHLSSYYIQSSHCSFNHINPDSAMELQNQFIAIQIRLYHYRFDYIIPDLTIKFQIRLYHSRFDFKIPVSTILFRI